MQSDLLHNDRGFCIGIAIFAKVLTAVIGADITREVTRTGCSCPLLFGNMQAFSNGFLIVADKHASTAICSILRQFIPLRTGLQGHAMGMSNRNHGLPKQKPVFLPKNPKLRKVPSHLWVKVYKADNNGFRISFQCRSNLLKCFQMIVFAISFRQKNRVVSPPDRIHSQLHGKMFEMLYEQMFIRHIRFYIFSIRCNSDKPILSISL